MFDYTENQARLMDALHTQWVLYREGKAIVRSIRHGNHVSRIDQPTHLKAAAQRNSAHTVLKFIIGTLMKEGVPKYRIKKALTPSNPENSHYFITLVEDFWSSAGEPPSAENLFLTHPEAFEVKNRPYQDRYKALKEVEFARFKQRGRLRREGKNREKMSRDNEVVQAVLAAHALGLTVNEITAHYEGGTRATVSKMIEQYG